MKKNGDNETTETSPANAHRSVLIDVDYYQRVIDDPEVSEARKRELIDIIGQVVVNFIDLGFEVHPVQQALQDGDADAGSNADDKTNQPSEEEQTPERIEP